MTSDQSVKKEARGQRPVKRTLARAPSASTTRQTTPFPKKDSNHIRTAATTGLFFTRLLDCRLLDCRLLDCLTARLLDCSTA